MVEDEKAVRELTGEDAEAAGLHVLPAASGAEALAIAKAHEGTIELLLTDVVMPGMSGRQLADELRRGGRT